MVTIYIRSKALAIFIMIIALQFLCTVNSVAAVYLTNVGAARYPVLRSDS